LIKFEDGSHIESGAKVYAHLQQVSYDCSTSSKISVQTGEEVETKDNLISVYPNPFKNEMTVDYTIKEEVQTSLYLINAVGKRIHTFFESNIIPIGQYKVDFTSDNLGTGVYYIVLESTNGIFTSKVINLKWLSKYHH